MSRQKNVHVHVKTWKFETVFHGVCLFSHSRSGSRLLGSGGGMYTSGEESSVEWSCAQLDLDDSLRSEEWLVRSKAPQLKPEIPKTNWEYHRMVDQGDTGGSSCGVMHIYAVVSPICCLPYLRLTVVSNTRRCKSFKGKSADCSTFTHTLL